MAASSLRTPAERFQDLVVWQRAHRVVPGVYKMTAGFPREEMYGLTSQVRRSAVSIAANIAEGFGKRSRSDKARFFNIAQGSLEETRSYFILAHDLGYTDSTRAPAALDEVGRLLQAYHAGVSRPCPPKLDPE